MSFFDRNRKALAERGVDPARLPPGQYFTERFPVLHAGSVPEYDDLSQWGLLIGGLVTEPQTLSWDDVLAMPAVDVVVDIHCVTKWSKFDMPWRGVPFDEVLKLVEVRPEATHLMCRVAVAHGIGDLVRPDVTRKPRCRPCCERTRP